MECNKSSHLWGTVAGQHCSHAENVCDLNSSAPAVSMPLSPGPQFIFHITWSLGGAQLWLQASDTNVLSTDKRTHDLPCCGSSLWIDFINFAHSLWSHIIWCCSVLLKKMQLARRWHLPPEVSGCGIICSLQVLPLCETGATGNDLD